MSWIARTGAPWRDLHEHFGHWNSAYQQFRRRWAEAGIFELMFDALSRHAAPPAVRMNDSTIVRAHHQAAGAKRGTQKEGFGRSKGGFTTKLHLRTSAQGLPISAEITGGEVSDYKGYGRVILPMRPAQGAARRQALLFRRRHADIEDRGGVPVIPMRKNRKCRVAVNDFICALRNRIERGISRFKSARRLATRYDKTALNYLAFIHIISTRLWVKHLVNRP